MRKTKRCGALLAAFMLFGIIPPALAFDGSDVKVIATHGQWRSFSVPQSDVSGVMSTMDDSEISVVLGEHGVMIFLRRNGWNLPERATKRIAFSIGADSTVEQVATVVSPDELAIQVIDDNFINQLLWSMSATAFVDGVPWRVDLRGFSDALHEAIEERRRDTQ